MELIFDAGEYSVSEVGPDDDPAQFLTVFNSNPSFVDASTLHIGVEAFTEEDVEMFLWHNTVMENSRCLVIRTSDRVVGALTLLVPHPREEQPWIGSFVVDADEGLDRVGGPVLCALERTLAESGWTSVFVGPMVSQQESITWWREQGYQPVERRLDNDKREVELHRKDFGE